MGVSAPRVSRLALMAILAATACGGGADSTADHLAGAVQSDGSSTVFPIAEAVAEEFQIANRDVRVTVGVSGTGGGFKRFCAGEIDFANASRPIRSSEIDLCAENGVEFMSLPVAWDGLSVIVNPLNDFVSCLTVAELRSIWEPGSEVRTWADIRAGFPAEEIKLYGPGTDSGTFDYFTEAVVGESGASRPDYQQSEDDNVLVQGIEGDHYALGYFGYAYYVENREGLKVLGVDSGSGCVAPEQSTIEDGSYAPLSRQLFIYLNRASLLRPEVAAYVDFFMTHARELVPATGYVALDQAQYDENVRAAAAN